jgi:hypothetical protein
MAARRAAAATTTTAAAAAAAGGPAPVPVGQRVKPEPLTAQEWVGRVLTDADHGDLVVVTVLLIELVLNVAIVLRVPCTQA